MVVAGSKEVVVHFGQQRCRLLLFEGSDSPSLNFALNSRLRLEGVPFHLTEPGDETLVPLSSALPGGLELVLHLSSRDLQPPDPEEESLDNTGAVAAVSIRRGAPAPSFSEDPAGGEKSQGREAEGKEANQAVLVIGGVFAPSLKGIKPLSLGMRESLLQPHLEAPPPDESLQLDADCSMLLGRTATFSKANDLQGAGSQTDQQSSKEHIELATTSLDRLSKRTAEVVRRRWRSCRTSATRIEDATESLDRYSRLNTDLANERTLLAWIRTAMSAIRTAFALLAIGSEGELWVDWVYVTRLFIVTLVLVSTLSGISRYHRVKKATFEVMPPQHFGRVSIFWFNGTCAGCAIATVAAMYLNNWHKI